MELDVLFEDDDLIVVNKPAGMVVHPTYKNPTGTLLDELRAHAGAWPDSQNPTIVGRLDKNTSGIVIAAKSAAVHAQLQRTLSSSESEKIYLAVVRGNVAEAQGTIALPLRIDPGDRRRVIVSKSHGAPAETRFERLAVGGGLTALRCRLMTGRRHQIRVHLAASGWPVVGDRAYGEAAANLVGHALHAWQVSFAHPASNDRLVIRAPIPAELVRLAANAGVQL